MERFTKKFGWLKGSSLGKTWEGKQNSCQKSYHESEYDTFNGNTCLNLKWKESAQKPTCQRKSKEANEDWRENSESTKDGDLQNIGEKANLGELPRLIRIAKSFCLP